VRMAVVPGDELGGGVRAGAVLALDAEAAVVRRTDRVDDRVVAIEQLRALDVLPELDRAEEAEARLRGRLRVADRDRLDLRVVGEDIRGGGGRAVGREAAAGGHDRGGVAAVTAERRMLAPGCGEVVEAGDAAGRAGRERSRRDEVDAHAARAEVARQVATDRL